MAGQEKRQKIINENEDKGGNENGDKGPEGGAKSNADEVLLDKILSNYLITDEIFKYISHRDLLYCSLVSKSLNAASRDFLKRQATTLLCMNIIEGQSELQRLVKLLESDVLEGNHPFRGILLDFSNDEGICNDRDVWDTVDDNRKLLQRIFAKMDTLHISLNIKQDDDDIQFNTWYDQEEYQNNRGLVFDVYKNYATALPWKEITSFSVVKRSGYGLDDIFGHILSRRLIFPNLKSINFDSSSGDLKSLFSACPSLMEWKSSIGLNELPRFINTNKTSVIKSLRIRESYDYVAQRADMTEKADLRLKKLVFLPHISKLNVWSENIAVLAKLVRSSVMSLEELHTDCRALLLIQNHQDFPQLVNVRKLLCKNTRNSSCDLPFRPGRNPCLELIFPMADLILG